MASLMISGIDEIIRDMERMGESSGKVAEAMIDAAAAVARDCWAETAEEYGLHASGDMIESIGFPVSVKSAAGLSREIYPQGTDSKGVRNAEKAFYLHYGTSRITANYWVDDAESRLEGPALEAMEAIWGQFLETGQVPSAAGVLSGSGVTVRSK